MYLSFFFFFFYNILTYIYGTFRMMYVYGDRYTIAHSIISTFYHSKSSLFVFFHFQLSSVQEEEEFKVQNLVSYKNLCIHMQIDNERISVSRARHSLIIQLIISHFMHLLILEKRQDAQFFYHYSVSVSIVTQCRHLCFQAFPSFLVVVFFFFFF